MSTLVLFISKCFIVEAGPKQYNYRHSHGSHQNLSVRALLPHNWATGHGGIELYWLRRCLPEGQHSQYWKALWRLLEEAVTSLICLWTVSAISARVLQQQSNQLRSDWFKAWSTGGNSRYKSGPTVGELIGPKGELNPATLLNRHSIKLPSKLVS